MKVRARHWICADGVWKEPGATFETDDLTELEGMVDVLSTEVRQGNKSSEIVRKDESIEIKFNDSTQTEKPAEEVPSEKPVTKRSRRNAKRQ